MQPDGEPELGALQRALLAEIRGVRPRRAGAGDGAAWISARSLEQAREHLAVYGEMYALRLLREVAREYPATRALLGQERFEAVAAAFVARTGSRSFTLEGYAGGLPAFLRRLRSGVDPALRASAAALASYERERSRVLRAPVKPRHERAGRMQSADGARLLAYAWAVDDAYARYQRRMPVRELWAAPTRLALFRRPAPDAGGRVGLVTVAALRVCDREVGLLRSLLRGQRIETAEAIAREAGLGAAAIDSALRRWAASGLLRMPA
jgi:hypothetical protein